MRKPKPLPHQLRAAVRLKEAEFYKMIENGPIAFTRPGQPACCSCRREATGTRAAAGKGTPARNAR
jgi:hypothetical protein